jgi:hypothetical protein
MLSGNPQPPGSPDDWRPPATKLGAVKVARALQLDLQFAA